MSTLTVPAAGAECGVLVQCCDVGRGSNSVSGDQCSGQREQRRGTSSVETEDRGGCQHSVTATGADSVLQNLWKREN